jgi:hypothetical protein
MLYPDRFAGVISWVGGTGDATNTYAGSGTIAPAGAVGNMIDFTASLLHVPTALLNAAEDPLLQISSAEALADRFRKGESPFEYFLHPVAEHTTFADLDEWGKEAAYTSKLVRVKNPARVRFRTDSILGNEFYDLHHDQAYWVSEVRGRDKRFIDVDATSLGCGRTVPAYVTGKHAGEKPVPWVSDFREQNSEKAVAAEPRLELELDNVRSLTIDAKRACLDGKRVAYTLKADGALTVNLSDGRSIAVDALGTYQGVLAKVKAPKRTRPLRFTISVASRAVSRNVLLRGLQASANCSRSCTVEVAVRAGKQLLGSAKVDEAGDTSRTRFRGHRTLRLRLSQRVISRLRRSGEKSFTLRAVARDSRGHVRVRTVALRLSD